MRFQGMDRKAARMRLGRLAETKVAEQAAVQGARGFGAQRNRFRGAGRGKKARLIPMAAQGLCAQGCFGVGLFKG